MNAQQPRIALTIGDVAGIGPELVVRAVNDSQSLALRGPIIVGHPELVRRTAHSLNVELHLAEVASVAEIDETSTAIPCWNPGRDDVLDVASGRVQRPRRSRGLRLSCRCDASRAGRRN